MPIIIDTNCFAHVFSRSSSKHNDFEPVLTWILDGKGLIVYGGSQYQAELRKATKYLTIFRRLKEIGKVCDQNDTEIDALQARIQAKVDNAKFNDIHLLAISLVTKCRIICSEDVTSISFVTDRQYLPIGSKKPVYYTSKKNKDLLCDRYIPNNLKPLLCKIKKQDSARVSKFME